MTLTDHHHSNDRTIAVVPSPSPAVERSSVTIPQYSRRAIFAIWAAAAVPMAALAWIVAPLMASSSHASSPLVRALLVCMTAGLVWQFVLVATGRIGATLVAFALGDRDSTAPGEQRR